MVAQIIVGVLVACAWGVVIYFSQNLVDIFGRIVWAENHLSGTRNAYIFWGFGIIIVGFLILFGVIPLTSPMETVPVVAVLT